MANRAQPAAAPMGGFTPRGVQMRPFDRMPVWQAMLAGAALVTLLVIAFA